MTRALLLLSLAACEDSLDQRLAIIDEPRVLAVIGEPAEAKPGAQVTYHAVLASPDGPLAIDPRWAFCTASKPPTEDNAVATPCTQGEQLVDLGTAETVTGTLPRDGCILFGPDTPPGGFRPRDADSTGGYYQPVRVDADRLLAFGLSRITCKLPTAPTDVAHDYDLHYVANQNPALDPIGITEVPANSDVTLTATWPAESVESYLYYDPQSQHLVTRHEAMRVSWFATGGAIDVDASAVGEDRDATSVTTTWHTPGPGSATVWFVLRDSRGGLAVQVAPVDVR
ncbi:MAG TPA: hypothetical protein VLB44_15360 [Kofleriaceae bacterium]|nr:hypothetical protein [Kofleriaceae bacterium]